MVSRGFHLDGQPDSGAVTGTPLGSVLKFRVVGPVDIAQPKLEDTPAEEAGRRPRGGELLVGEPVTAHATSQKQGRAEVCLARDP